MKKETFVAIIKALMLQMDQNNDFIEALSPFFDGHPVCTIAHKLHDVIIKALKLSYS